MHLLYCCYAHKSEHFFVAPPEENPPPAPTCFTRTFFVSGGLKVFTDTSDQTAEVLTVSSSGCRGSRPSLQVKCSPGSIGNWAFSFGLVDQNGRPSLCRSTNGACYTYENRPSVSNNFNRWVQNLMPRMPVLDTAATTVELSDGRTWIAGGVGTKYVDISFQARIPV